MTEQKRVWLYCHDDNEARWALSNRVSKQDCVVGISYHKADNSTFPHSGLIPAMQAAMRGDIDILMATSLELLGRNFTRVEELQEVMGSYGVSVRSFSNEDSNNS